MSTTEKVMYEPPCICGRAHKNMCVCLCVLCLCSALVWVRVHGFLAWGVPGGKRTWGAWKHAENMQKGCFSQPMFFEEETFVKWNISGSYQGCTLWGRGDGNMGPYGPMTRKFRKHESLLTQIQETWINTFANTNSGTINEHHCWHKFKTHELLSKYVRKP